MAQFKVTKTGNFTVLSNRCLSDPNLSNKSKGLLCTMLSLPPKWNYTISGLSTICPRDGPDAIKSQLRELEKNGYLIRGQDRSEKGKFLNSIFEVFEKPWWELPEDIISKIQLPLPEKPITENPLSEDPLADKPSAENPLTVNPMQLNTEELNNNQLKTYLINNPSINLDRTDRRTVEQYVKDMVEFDLIVGYMDRSRVEEITTTITDLLCTTKESIKINGEYIPYSDVADRLFKIDSEYVGYILTCIDESPNKIENLRAFLSTAIFNAPATMNNYYSALFEWNEKNRN